MRILFKVPNLTSTNSQDFGEIKEKFYIQTEYLKKVGGDGIGCGKDNDL